MVDPTETEIVEVGNVDEVTILSEIQTVADEDEQTPTRGQVARMLSPALARMLSPALARMLLPALRAFSGRSLPGSWGFSPVMHSPTTPNKKLSSAAWSMVNQLFLLLPAVETAMLLAVETEAVLAVETALVLPAVDGFAESGDTFTVKVQTTLRPALLLLKIPLFLLPAVSGFAGSEDPLTVRVQTTPRPALLLLTIPLLLLPVVQTTPRPALLLLTIYSTVFGHL
ncbi:hypothetical protein F2Q68_00007823 [Brassica cretica]|uniref:Uncharacterized protein n=1 Tax=Brassica cretica TaxID=69181 RepID=A0A8S9KQZ6_BRACR|nr:hypothetical protein F2Q68_00007823 [Brassica cretica]